MSPFRWVVATGAVAFTAAFLLTSVLQLPRASFVLAWTVIAAGVVGLIVRQEGVHVAVQLRRRWPAGVAGGVVVGLLLARTVVSQPGSESPAGTALLGSLAWLGVVYGAVDAVILSVLPVLLLYGMRPVDELRHAGARWRWAGVSLAASLAITAAYHLGFAEFRGAALAAPLVGNGVITVSYLLTGSPLAPIVAHGMMHAAAVLHGVATTVQLPPHY